MDNDKDRKIDIEKLKEDVIRQDRAGIPFSPLSILKEDVNRVAREMGFNPVSCPECGSSNTQKVGSMKGIDLPKLPANELYTCLTCRNHFTKSPADVKGEGK